MHDDENYYVNEIFEKGKNRKIKKVIIDIRQNGGGNDMVWWNILSSIIKEPLDVQAKIGFKNTERALNAVKDKLEEEPRTEKAALLNNEEFKTVTYGGIIKPSDSTLGFEGKIYVLQDRMIYSSAGVLSDVAKNEDSIVSVGETTGILLGHGLSPVFFTLPNTGLIFQLEAYLDLSKESTLYDYYHDNVEIPVEITVEQKVKYSNSYNFNQDNGIYSKEFLYSHDPVFQKVLELE